MDNPEKQTGNTGHTRQRKMKNKTNNTTQKLNR